MRNYILLFSLLTLLFSCKNENKKNSENDKQVTYISFGEQIKPENFISNFDMAKKFEGMKVGDTIDVKFKSTITAVCKKKGCWIKVPLDKQKNSFVKFKDYGFFMPMNSEGTEVILNGKAFINEISVKQLQHYAKDAGKPDSIINKIVEPKTTYSFLADGVLLASDKVEN